MNTTTGECCMGIVPSPEQTLPLVSKCHQVTEVIPAKRITFFKSGDPQFNGIKMAINRRSFKSFSALMDDLSSRVPLPFGVRTITTPRGTHSVNRLDQLVDGGSYICSDKKYVHPIAPIKPGRKMTIQRPGPPVSSRIQSRQGEREHEYTATHFQQVPKPRKKITLVKNGDPSIRRSIIINRTNGQNLKSLLEEASDLLQFTVRRLYTMEGRRIENIQDGLQSQSVLICVGREPFRPIQLENVGKCSSERLPGINSETMDNRKNVNFGLNTKKSVIHPRSESSSKTRFSFSSEKSFLNGLNMSPANNDFASSTSACPHGKSEDSSHSLVNEDIEKRVHVNKDGSLSVEMKVRFRLLNEETLQWSTQIKKSSNLSKGKCEQVCLCDDGKTKRKEMDPELFSETDESFYPCDADSYGSKPNDEELEGMCCAHCGLQCQSYDIWKNPMHVNQQEDYINRGSWQTLSSASSTSSCQKVICNQNTPIDSLHRTSSEEFTRHIVHKSSHYSETKDCRETRVMYSAVSRCTSQSGHSSAASSKDIKNEHECKCSGKRQNKSLASSESQHTMKNDCFVSEDDMSPRSSSCSEINKDIHSQRVSVDSKSSAQSNRSLSRVKKKNSKGTMKGESNLSLKSDEKQQAFKKVVSIPTENNTFEDKCSSSVRNKLLACNRKSNEELESGQENEQPVLNSMSSNTGLSDCEKCSNKSSSHSATLKKKRVPRHNSYQSNEREELSSPCSSYISKQTGDIMLSTNGSIGHCDSTADPERPISSTYLDKCFSEKKETVEQQLQSQFSFQSVSSLTGHASVLGLEEQRTSIKSSGTNSECTEDDALSETGQDRKMGLTNETQSSSVSRVSSSRHDSICLENKNAGSSSSRTSSNCDKKCNHAQSIDICGSVTSNGSLKKASNHNTIQSTESTDENKSINAFDCQKNCVFHPSPPKVKPSNKQRRSSEFKNSSSSECSYPAQITNGENSGSSRSTTPASRGVLEANTSTDTCKKLSNNVNSSNRGTEEIPVPQKRKYSSSSSKRRLKNETFDTFDKIKDEITPNALPNVTSEEVVHEWLRKIPSQTMVIEYESEETQTKKWKEAQIVDADPKTDRQTEDTEEENEIITQIENSSHVQNETLGDVICSNDVCNRPEKEDIVLSNGIEQNDVINSGLPETTISDEKKSTINTSVQIMKALLSSSQESKFDRSYSLPEVSASMGKKLSNSAKVLISCLASLQLLDESPTNCIAESNVLNKPKYTELHDIFQSLWADNSKKRQLTNAKCRKHYSRENEVTPVSSSGVDVNSGCEGSGDGSVAGAGDCTVVSEKIEKSKLPITVNNSNSQPIELAEVASENEDLANKIVSLNNSSIITSDCFNEDKSCYIDENMNEKIAEDSESILTEGKPTNYDENGNNPNEELTKNVEHTGSSNETLNIHSHAENNPESDYNCDDTKEISSQSDVESNVIVTSDSNGKKDLQTNKLLNKSDPIWALKLLKKIESEFMMHYVDAMNDFKVKWNLENNENLEEMIAELKDEVGQRIQKSIANELKKIRNGQKIPRPPDEQSRRKSSIQAEERRKRLQTMHKRSALQLENGVRGAETNDISSETDEEDLTFSASFGEDANGFPNDEEFCPCETCIKKKRELKLSKPKPVACDAPITRAFDLQQILKMKKENNEAVNVDISNPALEETISVSKDEMNYNSCNEEIKHNVCEELSSQRLEEQRLRTNSTHSKGEPQTADHIEQATSVKKTEEYSDGPGTEPSHDEGLENEDEDVTMQKVETCFEKKQGSCEQKSREHSTENVDNEVCEQEQQTEQGHDSLDMNRDHTEDQSSVSEARLDEVKDDFEDTDEVGDREAVCDLLEENAKNKKNGDRNEVTIHVIRAEGNDLQDTEEFSQSNGSSLQKSHLTQCSLITQHGSAEDEDVAEDNNVEESSTDEHAMDSNCKQAQMYPGGSSEDEDGSSRSASPNEANKNGSIESVNSEFCKEEVENQLKKATNVDIIEEDEFDF